MPFAQEFLRPYARLAIINRLVLYGALSTLAVSTVIFNAFRSYSNFYAVAVHLSRSNRSVMVLANFGILCSVLAGHAFQQIFFGSLRPSEVERLYDKIWFFLTESLLAFTIFRDEFDASFAVMFGFLLFVKCFHWLMSFRIEWMDQVQYPGPNVWFHIRINVLFFFLWFIDVIMVCFSIESILTNGIGAVVLFASEYSILLASALNSISKYLIIWYDTRRAASRGGENAPVWENKSMYIFYVELITDFLKLVTYMTFFLIVLTFYGLPLNIVRDIYITARSFYQRCRDLVRYRTATRNMDERYPNATEADLTQLSDRTCIICREEMHHREPSPVPNGAAGVQPDQQAGVPHRPSGINDTPKKLPCGHVFHFHCLRSWLERQQSCPTCRRTVLDTRPVNGPGIVAGVAQGGLGANAPVPGAVPQPNGNIGGVRPQGFLARWLQGAGMAPPLVPGQFAPGPMAENFQGQAQVPGQMQQPLQPLQQQQPQPFGFPNPFGPWLQPQAPQNVPQNQQYQQPLQQQPAPAPVQVLQGFYIGNQWQPWGQEQQQQPPYQNHVAPQTQADRQSQPQASQPHSVQGQSTTPTPTIPAGSDSTSAATSTAVSSDVAEAPTTPREAAALAAMRRLGPNYTASSSDLNSGQNQNQDRLHVPNTSRPPVRSTSPNTGTNNSNAIPSLIPPVSSQPSTSTNSTSATTPANARAPSPSPYRTTPVPSLIPLFDPASTSATIVPPPPGNRTNPGTLHHPQSRSRSPYLSSARTSGPTSQTRLDDTTVPELRGLLRQPTFSLTDEQLARLDTVTREAIDERLRILEEVQGVMWRCSEELVRVRSLLPPIREQNDGTRSTEAAFSSSIPGSSSQVSSGVVIGSPNTNGTAPNPSTSKNADLGAPTLIEPTASDPESTSESRLPLAEASSNMENHVRSGKEPER